MISGATPSCYPNGQHGIPIYSVSEEIISSNRESTSETQSTQPTSFLYNLSILKDKVHQVQSLATIFLSPDHSQQPDSKAVAIATLGTLIQEIMITASSMMFSCQQMSLDKTVDGGDPLAQYSGGCDRAVEVDRSGQASFYSSHNGTVMDYWYGENYNNCNSIDTNNLNPRSNEGFSRKQTLKIESKQGSNQVSLSPNINYDDIIELDAADLLAKYTHYCQVCGKGFKRDANLRMHMRAHGEEYKSSSALSNPVKNSVTASGTNTPKLPKKYSCPHEGCRWNKNHARFQPLKSMICVKNHYRRSHCPKMYVCKRCNSKNFSVLSDLRTHEKHCGDVKWLCSCGTTFSRKDKLMGHVALFIGHTPAVNSLTKTGLEIEPQTR